MVSGMDYTDEQREALTKARQGADMMLIGRRVRDRAIKAALATGLSERQVAEGIGRKPGGGQPIVSTGTIHRVSVSDVDPEDYV